MAVEIYLVDTVAGVHIDPAVVIAEEEEEDLRKDRLNET